MQSNGEQSSTTPGNSSDITKDNFIPIFSNRIADYREWRLRIGLYFRKMTIQNKKKEATINLLTSLHGLAWRQIEHIADKLVDEDEGFSRALQILDTCFKYNEKVEMPRAFEKFFYSLHRQPTKPDTAFLHHGASRAPSPETCWTDGGTETTGSNTCGNVHGRGED